MIGLGRTLGTVNVSDSKPLSLGWAIAFCLALLTAPSAATEREWEYPSKTMKAELHFVDAEGHRGGLERFSGSPLLINFWASWCAPCLIELPALDRLAQDPARGPLHVVALSLDQKGIAPVLDVFRRAKIHHLQPLVDSGHESLAGTTLPALPFTMLVSAQGCVLAMRRGRVDWDSLAERKALRALMSASDLDGERSEEPC